MFDGGIAEAGGKSTALGVQDDSPNIKWVWGQAVQEIKGRWG